VIVWAWTHSVVRPERRWWCGDWRPAPQRAPSRSVHVVPCGPPPSPSGDAGPAAARRCPTRADTCTSLVQRVRQWVPLGSQGRTPEALAPHGRKDGLPPSAGGSLPLYPILRACTGSPDTLHLRLHQQLYNTTTVMRRIQQTATT